ncbi:hypothetical protein SNR37_004021 [Agarivorans aestuarii]|uniref:Uncharacterized protein n=1 Tax=Agarivorans aestuarii TaxID=1563703 RepID=A0ABU7G593_9ALTE|nr:hypothetical protein [Agarivorans aestuarii]MEE1674578.1 hypothetical protein [Agarivorans aestuarii]
MKLWTSLLISSIALTSLNAAAVESAEHASQGVKYSALGASNGGQASVEVATTAVAVPITAVTVPIGLSVVLGGGDSDAAEDSAFSALKTADAINKSSPFAIGEEIIIGSSN